MKHLIAKGDLNGDTPTQVLDQNTVMISLKDIESAGVSRVISDTKEWSEDVGFAFFANEDAVHSSVSPGGTVVKEIATVLFLIEL